MTHWTALRRSATAAIFLTLVGCGGGDGAQTSATPGVTESEIVIGTTTALTGVVAADCKPINDGAAAWFASINDAGGIDGRMIDNIVLDDAYDAAKALSNARELASEPILAYFGGCGSLQPPAVLSVAEPGEIPYLFPSAGLTDIIANPFLRTLYPVAASQFRGITEWALNDRGAAGTFLVNARLPGYEVTRDAMQEGVEAAGGTVLGDVTITAGEGDMTPLALQFKESGAEYLVSNTNSADGSRIFKALQSADALPRKHWITHQVFLNDTFLDTVGANADGLVLTPGLVVPPSSDKAESCVTVLEEADVKPDISSLYSCAFAQVLTSALEETENLNRESLLATLDGWKAKQVSELLAPITFSAEQHVGQSTMGVLAVEGGVPVELEATFKLEVS